jgi:hypothetical protein
VVGKYRLLGNWLAAWVKRLDAPMDGVKDSKALGLFNAA